MAWKDLRDWMDHLERQGDLVRVGKPVSTRFEIGAYIRKSSDTDGPAFLFENVSGFPGRPVVAGLYGVRRRILDALDCPVERLAHRFMEGVDRPIPARRGEGPAPCQEVVLQGAAVDLDAIPVVTHSEKDGPFITAGVQVAPDPDTGVHGLGIHRMERLGRDRLGLWAPAERRIGRAQIKSNERGRPQPIAVVIGPDPYVELAAAARVPHTQEKYDIAGGLAGAPVELVRCRTVDVWVPANAEMIIEGEIWPGETVQESQFGEFPGCYGGLKQVPVMRVTGVTMRRDAIYHTVLTGFPVTEDHLMNWPAMVAVVWADAIRVAPEVRAVDIRGNYVYEAVVQMRKRHQTEPWNVMSAILSGASHAKYCMVVDEDVDIFNDRDIDWAFCTRVQPDRDVHVFPIMVGAPLDPSAPIVRQTSKMGIDATIPFGADRTPYERVVVPGTEDVSW